MRECKNLNRKPKRRKHLRLERSWCIVESFHWESVFYGCVDYYFIVFTILREKCSYSEFFWSIFYRIRTEYGEIRSISPYSFRMLENTDLKSSEYEHFSCSVKDVLRIQPKIYDANFCENNYSTSQRVPPTMYDRALNRPQFIVEIIHFETKCFNNEIAIEKCV